MNFLVDKVSFCCCLNVCSHLDIRSCNRSIDTLEMLLYSLNPSYVDHYPRVLPTRRMFGHD